MTVEVLAMLNSDDWTMGEILSKTWAGTMGRLSPTEFAQYRQDRTFIEAALLWIDTVRHFERAGGRLAFIDPPDPPAKGGDSHAV
jgi:hypothetical protein